MSDDEAVDVGAAQANAYAEFEEEDGDHNAAPPKKKSRCRGV